MTRIRTSLGHSVGTAPASAAELERLAGRAWRERGIAVINPDTLADPWEAQVVRNVAARLYGQRNGARTDQAGNRPTKRG